MQLHKTLENVLAETKNVRLVTGIGQITSFMYSLSTESTNLPEVEYIGVVSDDTLNIVLAGSLLGMGAGIFSKILHYLADIYKRGVSYKG